MSSLSIPVNFGLSDYRLQIIGYFTWFNFNYYIALQESYISIVGVILLSTSTAQFQLMCLEEYSVHFIFIADYWHIHSRLFLVFWYLEEFVIREEFAVY